MNVQPSPSTQELSFEHKQIDGTSNSESGYHTVRSVGFSELGRGVVLVMRAVLYCFLSWFVFVTPLFCIIGDYFVMRKLSFH